MDGKSVSGVVPDSSAQALPLVDGSTTAESSMVTPWSAPVSAPELSPSSAPAPLYTSFCGTDAWDTPGRLGAARHAHSGEPPAPEPGHWARQTRTRGLERSNGPPPKLPATGDPARAVHALPLSIQVEDGRLLLRFTRPLAAGGVALDPQVSAVHLWAVGSTEGLSCS